MPIESIGTQSARSSQKIYIANKEYLSPSEAFLLHCSKRQADWKYEDRFWMMSAFIYGVVLHKRCQRPCTLTTSPQRVGRYSSPRRSIKRERVRRHGPSAVRMESADAAHVPQKSIIDRVWDFVTLLFPVWTVAAAGIALSQPGLFSGLTKEGLMQRMLSLLMLSTGLTLTGKELADASRRPWALLFGFLCCYAAMPGLAYLLMKIFGLGGVYGAGLLLLGVVSGGQTSNLCTLIAGGDVALSVAMTTLTSATSVIAVPSLSAWLLGQAVEVDPLAVGRSTLELVALPLLLGAGLNTLFPGVIRRIKGALPVVGILTVLVLIVGPVAETSSMFFGAARTLALPVMLLHVLGGLVGFVIPMLCGAGRRTAVTTGFEAGFKSPVLSFVLARQHFGDGVGMASVVSIVVLAPLAALFAVVLRVLNGGQTVGTTTKKGALERASGGWRERADVDGIGEAGRDNTRRRFRVVGRDGRACIVAYEQLSIELGRARRRGGVRAVERVME